jgi:hypothetical protein
LIADRGPNPTEKQEVIYKWYYEQLAYFVKLLKDTPGDQGGSLLDSTMIVTCSDVENGHNHAHYNIPMLVLGGRNLGIKHTAQGRVLKLGDTAFDKNASHNRLLISTANVLGHSMQTFGKTGDRPLTELFA